MTREEFDTVGRQLLLFGSLVREIELDEFLRHCEHSDAMGPLFAPSHWIAGRDKLEMLWKLARTLRAFQAALPTLEQAMKLDADALRRAEQLGLDGAER